MSKIINGTTYHDETPDVVIQEMETARQNNRRVRIFYGDLKTGQCWLEENDVVGYIGRSTGESKIPLLVANSRSTGGTAISGSIVRLLVEGREVYRHPLYNTPKFYIKEDGEIYPEVPFKVYVGDENVANFKKLDQAKRWIAFMRGERMGK